MKNYKNKNEEGVSPVIGVILMVAITVILAAVIASFVFGMAGQISKTKIVAVTAQRTSGTTAMLTNMGGQDVGTLSSITVMTDKAAAGTMVAEATGLDIHTGDTLLITPIAVSGAKLHIIIVGKFTDSSTEQVLLDTNI